MEVEKRWGFIDRTSEATKGGFLLKKAWETHESNKLCHLSPGSAAHSAQSSFVSVVIDYNSPAKAAITASSLLKAQNYSVHVWPHT